MFTGRMVAETFMAIGVNPPDREPESLVAFRITSAVMAVLWGVAIAVLWS